MHDPVSKCKRAFILKTEFCQSLELFSSYFNAMNCNSFPNITGSLLSERPHFHTRNRKFIFNLFIGILKVNLFFFFDLYLKSNLSALLYLAPLHACHCLVELILKEYTYKYI